MLNPRIVSYSPEQHEVKSNCGSLTLKEPVVVERYDWIYVDWMDQDGEDRRKRFSGKLATTLQHEIEHNSGILITD